MALMTPPPTFDKPMLDPKADALAPTDAMAVDTEANGTHDDLFDEPVNGTDASATEELKPTTNGDHTASDVPAPAVGPPVQSITDVSSGIDGIAQFVPDQTDNNSLFGDDTVQSVTEATEAPTSDVRDEPAPTPPSAPTQTQATTESTQEVPETQVAASIEPASTDAMDTTADALVDSNTAPVDSDTAPPTKPMKELSIQPESTTPAKVEPADQAMEDVPQSSKVRPREDFEEGDEYTAPEAKRTKTEEASSSQADIKSELPAQLVQANGASTPRGDGTATPRGVATVISSEPSGVHRAADYEQWPTTPLTQAQNKFLLERIRNTKKIKVSLAFKDPVDPVVLNIPSYTEIVTKPMDLSTMEGKLKANKYTYVKEFMEDLDQMIENSELFNNKQHPVTQAGYNLRAYFLKGMNKMPRGAVDEPAKAPKVKKASVSAAPKPRPVSRPAPPTVKSPAAAASPPAAWPLGQDGMPIIRRDSTSANDRPKRDIHRPSKDLPYSNAKPRKKKYQQELKFCESVLTELMKPKYQGVTYPFMAPVDPVALNIPSYLKIIKKPMDFGTIERNFKNGVYQSAKDFHVDCMLVFQNCYKFNPEGDAVNAMGHEMENLFNSFWQEKDAWLAQHAPAPEQSPEMYSDDEDEEEDEEEEETDAAQAQFLAIQQQIAALNETAQQLLNAQKAGKRASPKAASKSKKAKAPAPKVKKNVPLAVPPPAKPGKPKAKARPAAPLSFAQKQDISEGISTLGDGDMRKAVQIIRNGCPHLANVNDDEMELDMDEINDETLRELLRFIKSLRGPKGGVSVADDDFEPPRAVHKQTTASRPKKNKPMGKTEQEDNMRKIQEKLQSFQGGASGSSQSPPAAHEEESSDDDSGSESEEE
ncbi:Bromodomain-containing protein [Didymella exigua CBS 183.55]|uniref:Bromodomain-containing protein n=1 Tax=Didymella exigua CBS 183.55 TaxID=1150837 RepID=A0A6A5R917_9PLEO|nr:Bromodomain-containing protein [Didymella exigua CBS 183.55]KAF1924731.1 Bromodomain-containing protein [Didymella exigua CBS 183.55]